MRHACMQLVAALLGVAAVLLRNVQALFCAGMRVQLLRSSNGSRKAVSFFWQLDGGSLAAAQ